MCIELIEDEGHGVHERGHVRLVLLQRFLEGFEICHPFDGKVVWGDVGFVEHEDKGDFGLVEDRAGVEHVGHEGRWGGGARGVDDVGDHGWVGGREGVGDDRAGGRPGEDLDLAGGVDQDVAMRM